MAEYLKKKIHFEISFPEIYRVELVIYFTKNESKVYEGVNPSNIFICTPLFMAKSTFCISEKFYGLKAELTNHLLGL